MIRFDVLFFLFGGLLCRRHDVWVFVFFCTRSSWLGEIFEKEEKMLDEDADNSSICPWPNKEKKQNARRKTKQKTTLKNDNAKKKNAR
jgi:hypothetical protein